MNLVLFLLCSGFVHFAAAANRFRRFYFNDTEPHLWKDSLEICKNHSMSFVTLYDEADAQSLQEFVSNRRGHTVWLGLQKIRKNVTTWSNGDPYTFNLPNVAVNEGEQRCGAVENNIYKDLGCYMSLDFMCYKGDEYHLIENLTKDWCQAQQYCRRHFDDLVSINDETQKTQVVNKGRDKTFWIGLLHDEWEWQDESCSTYRSWAYQVTSDHCTAQGRSSPALYDYSCASEAKTLCSKGKVRIVVITEKLTWENALDYCLANHSGLLQIEDSNDQEDVVEILKNFKVTDTLWIGLRQSRVFGFWIWSDRGVTYSNWENNQTPEMPLSQNCGVFNVTNSKWRDENCLHEHPFLCEEEISFNN
ncbi:macrophage mannose receptor 1 isoform X2 [Hippoglossus stenolepis]|uniref:macrophage mannose receptor 1 isoform X1 n=1 Tax=Hippoglossus stenolepis TaxID=195615 RepID=UPI001FAFCFDC|nr:macrophage mannose receptor 1 isoform X1 [Hippoglossus stenolepis]XP_035002941.2 macrophage mannose receptor 1 isoform X2 [Hippoglossus stenolepis]